MTHIREPRRAKTRKLRKIRQRLSFSIYMIVLGSSAISLLLTALSSHGILFQRDTVQEILFGFAAKDLLLVLFCILAIIVAVMITSHSTANPILQLTKAAREIAAGNFDVSVDIRGDRIAEYKELQRSFNLMARELKSNEYLRKDFIANVSHELKTPLSIISGYAHLLEEGGLTPEEQTEYARLIAGESDRLSEMTGNMLRLSRVDNPETVLKQETFPLGEYLRLAVLSLEPKWTAAGILLEADIPDTDYYGDPELLGQVWRNLIGNAIKFTPEGGTVSVRLKDSPEALLVTVSDTGIGMDKETAGRIFEQFYQGDTSHRREGSGLGLTLVRRIVELHKGRITVQSSPGQGSVFTVTLPKLPEKTNSKKTGVKNLPDP